MQPSDSVYTWAAQFIRVTHTLTLTHTAPIIRHTLIRTAMDMAIRTAVFTGVGVPAITDILAGTGLMDMDSTEAADSAVAMAVATQRMAGMAGNPL